MDLTEKIIAGIIALIAAGSLITYKVIKKKNSDNKSTINQNNNAVTNGDIIGGNKSVKN